MKRSIRRWLSLAFAPAAALVLLGLATPAQAVIVNDCNDIPSNLQTTDFLTVTQASGDCVIDQEIKIDGNIIITIQNGSLTINQDLESSKGAVDLFSGAGKDITTKKLTAGNTLKMVSGGAIMVDGDVISAFDPMSAAGDGNILIKGQKNVGITGNVVNNGENPTGSRSGSIQIDAYLGDTPTPFTIGAASGSNNGVGGYLDTRSTDAGGNSATQVSTGIRIQNGVENSVGDIVVTTLENSDGSDLGNIRVRNSNSRSGWIELIAHKGKITLPTGKLTTRGLNNKGAGNIYLFADTIEVQDGTIINASQNDNAQTTKAAQEVILAARRIAIPNGSNGLTVNVNGGGPSASQTSALAFTPQGAFTATSNDNILNLLWGHTINEGFFLFNGEVHFDGAGSAPLKVHADGSNSDLFITGYPIKFNGGKVTLTSKGATNHEITIGFFKTADYDGSKGLSFDNTDLVRINASGEEAGDNGGRIQIQTDLISLKAIAVDQDPEAPPTDPRDIVIKADGPMAGDGNGGQVIVIGTRVNLDPVSKARISADGAPNGTGNAIVNPLTSPGPHAVILAATGSPAGNSDLDFGGGAGRFKISATGGMTAGNAGSVKVSTAGMIDIRNAENVVNASARGNSGNGGKIQLVSNSGVRFRTPGGGNLYKVALNTKGSMDSGAGGEIEVLGAASATGQDAQGNPNSINVNAIMKVDADSTNNDAQFAGSIRLNDVTCRQWKSGLTVYPKTYWACVNPTNPSGEEALVADGANRLPQGLKDLLSQTMPTLSMDNAVVQIYAMDNISHFQAYFGQPISAPVGTYGIGINSYRVAASFLRVYGPNGLQQATAPFSPAATGSPTQVAGTIVHELGHHLDFIWGNLSQQLPFAAPPGPNPPPNHVTADLTRLLNSGACGNAFTAQTCANLPGGNNNLQNYQALGYSTAPRELFPIVFEHLISQQSGNPPAFVVQPDLERAVETQFLDMKQYIQGLINQPPQPVN